MKTVLHKSNAGKLEIALELKLNGLAVFTKETVKNSTMLASIEPAASIKYLQRWLADTQIELGNQSGSNEN